VRLTHISPLLYSDPAQDAADVAAMLSECVTDPALRNILTDAAAERWSLDALYARLGDSNDVAGDGGETDRDNRTRVGLVLAAAGVALLGVTIAFMLARRMSDEAARPYAPAAIRASELNR
jgi:hypothetical protein